MALSMYQFSVPAFVRGLEALAGMLAKGAAHAQDHGIDPSELVQARLAPDMMTLAAQVQRASDTSKLALERLSGVPAPKMADEEATFAEIQDRVARTIAYLRQIDAAALDGAEARTISLKFGAEFAPTFTGDAYLSSFALPNFYFHLTTAYAILRHKGVKLSKPDFLNLQA